MSPSGCPGGSTTTPVSRSRCPDDGGLRRRHARSPPPARRGTPTSSVRCDPSRRRTPRSTTRASTAWVSAPLSSPVGQWIETRFAERELVRRVSVWFDTSGGADVTEGAPEHRRRFDDGAGRRGRPRAGRGAARRRHHVRADDRARSARGQQPGSAGRLRHRWARTAARAPRPGRRRLRDERLSGRRGAASRLRADRDGRLGAPGVARHRRRRPPGSTAPSASARR